MTLFKTIEQSKKEQEKLERKLNTMKNKFTEVNMYRKGPDYEKDPERRKQCENEYNKYKHELKSLEDKNKYIYSQYNNLRNHALNEQFAEYLKQIKKSKSVVVETGNVIADEAMYDNYKRGLEIKYNDLMKELTDLQVDPNKFSAVDFAELHKKRTRLIVQADIIKHEYNTITVDDDQFKTREKITVDISPMDAYNMFMALKNEQDDIYSTWQQSVIERIRAEDKQRVKSVSEDDWIEIKKLYNLFERFTKAPAFERHKGYEWTDVVIKIILHYNTKDDYLNREITDSEISNNTYIERVNFDQLFDYDNKKITQSIIYLNQLYSDYKVYLENKKIEQDIESMKNALTPNKKTNKRNKKTDEV